jgi:4-carboxymuconolactone decarboxylase
MSGSEALSRGRAAAEATNPGIEAALAVRYDALLPGFSESLLEVAYGHYYTRDGLDEKTRYLITIGALTAIGAQTAPQLKINVQNALNAGATQREIAEAINQMALYGGLPATINGLNAAIEVFEAQT